MCLQQFGEDAVLAGYTRSISKFGKQSCWKEALRSLQRLCASSLQPRLVPFSAAMQACERAGQWQNVLSGVVQMWSRGFHVDALAYNVAFKALSGNDWVRVLSTFEHLLLEGAAPVALDSSCSTAMLAAGYSPGPSWQRIISFFTGLLRQEINPGTAGYNTVVAACLRGRDWAKALGFFEEMDQLKIQSDVFTFSSLISVMKESGWREKATELFVNMRGGRLTADVVTANAAISAAETGQAALDLLRETQKQELQPDIFSYSIVLDGMPETRWQDSVSLAQEMEDTATNPGAVALSALLPSIPWQMTLLLLHENQKRSLQMDEVLCGSVLSAFECPDGRAQGLYGSWSRAIDFWHWTSCTGLPINEVTRTSAMRAMCCNSQWLRASLLLADLPVSGISSPAVSSLCAMILTELEHEAHLDASHMSLISRMSRSCELYLGHSIKSPADLE